MRRRNERGMALLVVLALVTLLAALVSEVAFSSLVDLRLAETYRDTTRAAYLARGGLRLAQRIIAADHNDYDGDDERWARKISDFPVGDCGRISIAASAEDGKINVNNLVNRFGNVNVKVRNRLLRLFEVLEIDDPVARTDALIDWIDRDDIARPHGIESAGYAALEPARRCANAPLHSVDEIIHVYGFDADMLVKLRPHITVFGGECKCVNAASAPVLYALADGMDMDSAAAIVARRQLKPFRTLEELQELPGWQRFYWALKSHLRVKADFYRVECSASVNDGYASLTAVVDKAHNSLAYFKVN